jgi:hypothetical protein
MIAPRLASPYLGGVIVSRVLSYLILLALLLAPASMVGSHAAMAMPHDAAASTSGHFEDQEQVPQDQRERPMIDCAMACSAMPSADPLIPARAPLTSLSYKAAAFLPIDGTRPEADTPPPRLS